MTLLDTYVRNSRVVVGGLMVVIGLDLLYGATKWLLGAHGTTGLLMLGGLLLAILIFNAITLFQYTRENGWNGWRLRWTKRSKV